MKPFNGYKSITAYVIARTEEGLTKAQIAKESGKSVSYVDTIIRMWRNNQRNAIARAKAGGMKLPHAVAHKIANKAKALGVRPSTLARDVLINAFEFNMVDEIINSYSGSRA